MPWWGIALIAFGGVWTVFAIGWALFIAIKLTKEL